MCSRVAGAVLPRPHVGSKSVEMMYNLKMYNKSPDELEIFIETCSQVVSGIVSPSSPSHLCLRPSKVVSLWSLNTVYILPMIFFESVLFLIIRSSREVDGCIGKHSELDETKHLICKYLKDLNQRKLKLFEKAFFKRNKPLIYIQIVERPYPTLQPAVKCFVHNRGCKQVVFPYWSTKSQLSKIKGFSE